MGKIYKGTRINPGYKAIIYVDGKELDLNPSKVNVYDYGADSSEFGYFGSGPSQTAAAILYDITGDKELTKRYHQDFKREFIANFEQNGFVLLESQVQNWLTNFKQSEEGL
jgi:hypothetical protein